jgi:glucose-6-phosphate 1-dehydrogenase
MARAGAAEGEQPMIARFVVLGASGDLTARHLLPALAQLHATGALPDSFELYGVAQQRWSDEEFRAVAQRALARHAGDSDPAGRASFLSRLHYRAADLTAPGEVKRALGDLAGPVVAYLALPPALFIPTVDALGDTHLADGSHVVVEKPFGESLGSAQALNRALHRRFPERAVFRMDHFLGKQTVQNILGLRFANRIFEPLWNAYHIERVEIVWDEALTAEGRAAYYDRAGSLRDMVQNHLLQLLALVAMEVPRTLSERDLRDRKVEVLRAVRRFSAAQAERHTRRGRYRAGSVAGRPVGDYVEEPGVDPRRATETFAEVELRVDNWRWAGVPFLLRTGKALGHARREIRLRFQDVPHLAFGQSAGPLPNVLRLALDPDRVTLGVNINGPGDPFELEHVELETTLAPQDLTPYARLLLDVLRGDPTLSIRDDEAEESWAIVEPILDAWRRGRPPLADYAAGSDGPEAPAPRQRSSTPKP